MIIKNYLRRWLSILFFLGIYLCGPCLQTGQSSVSIAIIFEAGTFLSWSASSASFQLTAPDFLVGTLTNTLPVSYEITGSGVTRTTGLIQANINTLYSGAALQCQFGSYLHSGGNADLVAATPGFVDLGTTSVDIANKQVVSGSGKTLSGTLVLNWRARLTQDNPASSETHNITLTVSDT